MEAAAVIIAGFVVWLFGGLAILKAAHWLFVRVAKFLERWIEA
jgi:hypothetical protein